MQPHLHRIRRHENTVSLKKRKRSLSSNTTVPQPPIQTARGNISHRTGNLPSLGNALYLKASGALQNIYTGKAVPLHIPGGRRGTAVSVLCFHLSLPRLMLFLCEAPFFPRLSMTYSGFSSSKNSSTSFCWHKSGSYWVRVTLFLQAAGIVEPAIPLCPATYILEFFSIFFLLPFRRGFFHVMFYH